MSSHPRAKIEGCQHCNRTTPPPSFLATRIIGTVHGTPISAKGPMVRVHKYRYSTIPSAQSIDAGPSLAGPKTTSMPQRYGSTSTDASVGRTAGTAGYDHETPGGHGRHRWRISLAGAVALAFIVGVRTTVLSGKSAELQRGRGGLLRSGASGSTASNLVEVGCSGR